MILQALNDHYQRLLEEEDSEIAPPGYSAAKVSYALILNLDGDIVDILTLAKVEGKKNIPKVLLVPEQAMRTSGVSANILCDNSSYMIGIERNKDGEIKVSQEKYADFKKKNKCFLSEIKSGDVAAVNAFLEKWNPENALSHPVILPRIEELMSGSNLVFKVDGSIRYIHEQANVREAWNAALQNEEDQITEQCLLTGDLLPIARIHPLIKGIMGSQMSGAAMVSFNASAFTSYGKSQSYNAPISNKAAFAYGTALNYLIASDTNRVRLADTTMVFWADKKGGKHEEKILTWFLDPVENEAKEEDGKRRIAPAVQRQAKIILERIRSGLLVEDDNFQKDTRCYLLGLAPNAARLSVRFWQVSSFGNVITQIAQHYTDMDIIGMERLGGVVSPWRTLKSLATLEDSKNIPPLLGGQFLKTILSGQMYPQTLYQAALTRCHIGGEHGGVNTTRAAIVKAFLLRKYRTQNKIEGEELFTVSLNENNKNPAYLLGRLFSLLEKVQKDALGSINASIRDRYFGAASATPGSVFPLLLRLSRHHIAKAEYGNVADRKIQEVMNGLDAKPFPAHLNMEEQGLFILGYYHQNQANYTKNEKNEDKEG